MRDRKHPLTPLAAVAAGLLAGAAGTVGLDALTSDLLTERASCVPSYRPKEPVR